MSGRPRPDSDRLMCRDHDCPSKLDCLRYAGPVAEHQVWADQGREPGAERCGEFLPLHPREPAA